MAPEQPLGVQNPHCAQLFQAFPKTPVFKCVLFGDVVADQVKRHAQRFYSKPGYNKALEGPSMTTLQIYLYIWVALLAILIVSAGMVQAVAIRRAGQSRTL